MTLKSISCPEPFLSWKKWCSGYVLAMSRRISFSHGEDILMYSEYLTLSCETWALHSIGQAVPRKWVGIPLRTSSCETVTQTFVNAILYEMQSFIKLTGLTLSLICFNLLDSLVFFDFPLYFRSDSPWKLTCTPMFLNSNPPQCL